MEEIIVRATARHILVGTQKKCEEIKNQIMLINLATYGN